MKIWMVMRACINLVFFLFFLNVFLSVFVSDFLIVSIPLKQSKIYRNSGMETDRPTAMIFVAK